MNATVINPITALEEAYLSQLEHPEVKKALLRREAAQAKHDSVSRKLADGSSVVSLNDLSFWESEVVAAKAELEKFLISPPYGEIAKRKELKR
ncbi:hypothetical protein C9I43_00315 (plasmid) [Shewanella morhuae]|uniref:Uncharacterized protein n=1 Tax=Shewanella morhuae TaxID=365591 RepID=A0A380BY34_9GAMM|nr:MULTISPECIES: hypothetical protein [Shewanella]MCS6237549.1 hypothetical protein [Shewanella baltica]MCS6272126.1 hypothetical protein [Shewanella baltica]PTA51821.1 hypothetical protein C9I43_00315 [Shewanella morhuae]SUJ09183.1 Uncharacterised protein [Shewanella morhuae]